jgi:hypothetical protein
MKNFYSFKHYTKLCLLLLLLYFFQFYSAAPFRLRHYAHPKLYIFNRFIFSRFDLVMCQKYRKCDFHRQHGVLVTCNKITFLLHTSTKNCGKAWLHTHLRNSSSRNQTECTNNEVDSFRFQVRICQDQIVKDSSICPVLCECTSEE